MPISFPPVRLGFVPANRAGFSDSLAAAMRDEAVEAMQKAGIEVVVPSPQDTKVGCVENLREAERCAELFRRADVQGIVVGAVNFGEEQAAAWAVRQARLDVPVMLFGCQEEGVLRRGMARRDAFCGLLSIGEVMRQIGVPYSVAPRPILFPRDPAFAQAVDWFARVCRVVHGIRRARYGQVGTRPDVFWTCRFDEKRLQRLGPTTVVLDLSEAIAGASALADSDPQVQRTISAVAAYADVSGVRHESLLRSAKLEVFLRRFREEHALDALAIQCWISLERNFGVCSCTTMARLGDEGWPCACEADILGAMSMHAVMLASGRPAALADWNNLHPEDDELVNLWHCGVFPASFSSRGARMAVHELMVAGGGAPPDRAEGVLELVADPLAVTLCRITLDAEGRWKAVLAQGAFEDTPAQTCGSYGWCRVPHLQRLYRDVLLCHFPHHVAVSFGAVGDVLWEALGKYLGMEMYHATQETPGQYTPRLPFGRQG